MAIVALGYGCCSNPAPIVPQIVLVASTCRDRNILIPRSSLPTSPNTTWLFHRRTSRDNSLDTTLNPAGALAPNSKSGQNKGPYKGCTEHPGNVRHELRDRHP